MNAHTHRLAHTPVAYHGNETEEKVFKKKGFQGRFKRADRQNGGQKQGVGSRFSQVYLNFNNGDVFITNIAIR